MEQGEESQDTAYRFVDGQLSIVGQDLEEIPHDVATKFGPQVQRLDLSWNSISTLQNLDKFSNLEELIFDNNELTSDLEFPKLPKLHTLWLNKNQIDDVDKIFPKKSISKTLPSLTYVSLLNNPGCPNELTRRDDEDYRRYRYFMLSRIPKLIFLDAAKVTSEERKEAARIGHLMVVARPSPQRAASPPKEEKRNSGGNFNPLPQGVSEGGARGASFGVSKYVYYGTHSEGNRFIFNTDL